MSLIRTLVCACATAVLCLAPPAAMADLLSHRWSFDETGSAAAGRELADRIGGAPAVIRGNGAALNGSAVLLPGSTNGNQTPQAISAYIDLPNGIISSKPEVTVEIWATVVGSRSWQRLFDFGRVSQAGDGLGAPGEITGGGSSSAGGTQAADAFMLAIQRGGSLNTQRFSVSRSGAEQSADSSASIPLGTRHHFVATWAAEPAGGMITWYLNGAPIATRQVDHPPTAIEDVNNWLGRSQWSGDSNANVSYHECRIYQGVLSPAAILASRDAGPDASIPPVLVGRSVTMNHGAKIRIDPLAGASGEILPATLAIDSPPAAGTASLGEDGTILYHHTEGAPSEDGFTIRVENSNGTVATAAIAIEFTSALRIRNDDLRVPSEPPVTSYQLVNAFEGLTFSSPTCIASPPGEDRRVFICQKGGLLRVVPDVNASPPVASTFLDLPALLSSRGETLDSGGESGLLGLAFHPDYATNRQFFIFYSAFNGGIRFQRVSRFTARAANPNSADPASELILISQRHQANNHNGGDLHFGPDGYLYISVGDEGGGNDTFNRSQIITGDLFAGILRIDVDKRPGNVAPTPHASIPTDGGVARFSIPIDNPFVHTSLGGSWNGTYNGAAVSTSSVRREFFATGLRNPWRMSFDPLTGELWCADVGQSAREEINLITNGGNYGWAYREGTIQGPKGGAPANFNSLYHSPPLYEYTHGGGPFQGNSVTGGVVYRGDLIPDLYGKYLFADYGSGNVWALERQPAGAPQVERIAGEGGIVAFGYDPSNQDVLLADFNDNRILRLTAATEFAGLPPTLSETGLFADLSDLSPSPGLVPYQVNLPFWSDHALKRRWVIVPDGESGFGWSEDAPWSHPEGAVWVKHFDLEAERGNPSSLIRLETRLLVKTADGAYGVSYRWNEEQTEAHLVADEGEEFEVRVEVGGAQVDQTWQIPSRAACMVCHTPQANHALSFDTRQLNLTGEILGISGNQLNTLREQGYLDGPDPLPNLLPRHLRPDEEQFALEARIRSYLAVNCAYCHMEDGTAGGTDWDGRPHLTLAETGLLFGELVGNGGDPANRLLVPGDPDHSVLLRRVAATGGFSRMPPIATLESDEVAIAILEEWISEILPGREDYAAWRLERFESATSPEGEPSADPDGDGAANHEEFLAGTDPRSAADRPQLVLSVGEQLVLGMMLPENRSFRVHASTDLQTWTPWNVPGNQGLPRPAGPAILSAPLDEPARFFRVEIEER